MERSTDGWILNRAFDWSDCDILPVGKSAEQLQRDAKRGTNSPQKQNNHKETQNAMKPKMATEWCKKTAGRWPEGDAKQDDHKEDETTTKRHNMRTQRDAERRDFKWPRRNTKRPQRQLRRRRLVICQSFHVSLNEETKSGCCKTHCYKWCTVELWWMPNGRTQYKLGVLGYGAEPCPVSSFRMILWVITFVLKVLDTWNQNTSKSFKFQ